MPIKTYRPITPARRYYSSNRPDVTVTKPTKALCVPLQKTGGRNNLGRMTMRDRGGGNKRRYRVIDFFRDKYSIVAKVSSIEYDPNRNALIALVVYRDGEKRYIIAPDGLRRGDEIISGSEAPIKIGNAMPLAAIPVGVEIHNLELHPGTGGKLIRGAGLAAQILAKEGDFAHVKLPSGEIRLFDLACMATIGRVSNGDFINIVFGKAGRMRHMGMRPHVRGVAKNPIDHPMGGGEGRSHGGRHPTSPWGWLTKGFKTRKKNRVSNKFIVKRRK
jgi:large subunit ribosomal protein L2